MKNFKIGAKIFISFGVVVAFMLVSTLVVFFSNMTIIDNVDKIEKDSALQTAGNALKDNFLLTRINAVRLLSTTDAQVYTDFSTQAGLTVQDYATIYDLIAKSSFLEKFRAGFEKAEADFTLYAGKAGELGEANAEERIQIDRMNVAGATMVQYGDLIFRDQVQLLRDEIAAGNTTTDAQNRRVDRIVTGSDIALHIATFRMYAREMMASFDTVNMPQALEAIDQAYTLAAEYNQASTIATNRENSQMIMDAILEYRAALVDFGTACDRADALAAELSPLGLTALNSLTAAVEALDQAVVDQVQSTTNSASSSLVIVMIISVSSVFVAIAFALVIVRGLTAPMAKMVRAADSLALGDTDVDVRFVSKDEIGSLSTSFEKMVDGIKAQARAVEHLADGDLTVEVSPRSNRDIMGHSLHKMVDNLNTMFSEIGGASAQVATGSKQIAEGAQSLAQGSTEQAAAVQELSASISEIAQKTRDNAAMADKAADLAGSIKQSAETGSRQMDQMMGAVKEINQASEAISKVIKVIDDIAFQTNILALNAAVEAARAGVHGKGFAVVAEEVRSLAAKSAAAAKDTGALIANSMEKAQLGVRIADQTSASLTEIVSGINESSQLVGDIARSSEEQSDGIEQINRGINQVAQVVQQNSATAEQSAAASQQMSGQSGMLEQLISQFKLKDDGMRRWAMPPAGQGGLPSGNEPQAPLHSGEYGKY